MAENVLVVVAISLQRVEGFVLDLPDARLLVNERGGATSGSGRGDRLLWPVSL